VVCLATVTLKMKDTKTVDMSFPGYFFIQDEYCAFMCDEDGKIVCILTDTSFTLH
jgi:hypothetical protein